MGYQVIMWSVPLPRDWQNPPPEVIRDRVLPYVRDGRSSCCTMATAAAREPRGERASDEAHRAGALAQGYRFVTVPELLKLGRAESKARRMSCRTE